MPTVVAPSPHLSSLSSRAGTGTTSVEPSRTPLSKVTCFVLGTTMDPGTHLDYSINPRGQQLSIHVSASFLDSEVLGVGDHRTEQSVWRNTHNQHFYNRWLRASQSAKEENSTRDRKTTKHHVYCLKEYFINSFFQQWFAWLPLNIKHHSRH